MVRIRLVVTPTFLRRGLSVLVRCRTTVLGTPVFGIPWPTNRVPPVDPSRKTFVNIGWFEFAVIRLTNPSR